MPETPIVPKILIAHETAEGELFLIHTFPYSLIWVKKSHPAGLIVIDGCKDESVFDAVSEHFKFKGGLEYGEN